MVVPPGDNIQTGLSHSAHQKIKEKCCAPGLDNLGTPASFVYCHGVFQCLKKGKLKRHPEWLLSKTLFISYKVIAKGHFVKNFYK